MNQHIRNKLHNAAEASRLLGIVSAARVHLRKALPFRKAEHISVQISGITNDFKIRRRGSDFAVCLQMFAEHDYDLSWCEPYRAHVQELCHQIRSEGNVPVIIDAGANIGASTLLFARAFPDCEVYAVEPDRGNYAMLEANTRECSNVLTFRAGIWDRPTNLGMQWEKETGWAQQVEETDASDLPGITVGQLLAMDPKARPLIVKMDIEGAEIQALRSNNGWVDQVPLMIFEAHDNLHHWLGMWTGSMYAFMSCLMRRKREYLTKGENVFAFLHPQET